MNENTKRQIYELVDQYRAGSVSLNYFEGSLETLFYQLENVTKTQDKSLQGLINDLERIQFSALPQSQQAAVEAVVAKMEEILTGIPG